MADNNNNISNTMEIDSILAEARQRHAQTRPYTPEPRTRVAPDRAQAPAASSPRPAAKASRPVSRPAAEADPYRARTVAPSGAVEDDYVFIDENGSYSSPSASPRGGRTDKKRKKGKKSGMKVALIIIIVLVLAAAGGFTWYMMSGSSNFADNVVVSGVALGGMNQTEAKAALAPIEQKLADEIKVEVTAGDQKITLTKDDFTYRFDTDEILSDAQAYSEEKGIKSGEKAYEITLAVDEASCKAAAEKIAQQANKEPKSAEVEAFDADKSDMFTFKSEVVGLKVKNDETAQQLSALFKSGKRSGTLNAPSEELQPEYTAAYLKKNIKELSSFTTTSTNNWNGNENMRVSLAACNSSIINPGETWSFNDHTGNSNLESNGYKPAGVINRGKHEIGIGGGICQSSTTIYNAAILSGMEVVERYCHYYKSAYVDAGRDATIDYGNLDLKIKNPFKYQLFLKCYMDGVVLHAEIYGLPSDEFDDVQISTSSPSYFSTGYKVTTSRTFYKNGEVVRTDELPSSTYYTVEPGSNSSSKKSTSSKNSSSAKPDASSAAPEPDPQPDPEPDPQPDPEPDPQPDPEPDPEPQPDPQPDPGSGGEEA